MRQAEHKRRITLPASSPTFTGQDIHLSTPQSRHSRVPNPPARRMNGSFLCKLRDDLLRLCFYGPPFTAGAERLQARWGAGECTRSSERWPERRAEDFRGGWKKATNLSTKPVNMIGTSISPCIIQKRYKYWLRPCSASKCIFWNTLLYISDGLLFVAITSGSDYYNFKPSVRLLIISLNSHLCQLSSQDQQWWLVRLA